MEVQSILSLLELSMGIYFGTMFSTEGRWRTGLLARIGASLRAAGFVTRRKRLIQPQEVNEHV